MVLVFIIIKMEKDMKEILKMIKKMDMEYIIILMGIDMKENSKKDLLKEGEHITIKMEKNI